LAPSALGIGGSTWSYHSDEFDDIISDASGDERAGAHAAPAHDAGALRDNGKDPASDDDADQMPLLVNSTFFLIEGFFDWWWALFGNRAAENNNEGDSVY
jgi:hypothetical protein